MAYGNVYPATYQPQYYPQYQQGTQMSSANQQPIIWVQGEAGAKSYLVAPNTTVLLMDSEAQKFYLKSTDISGMPMPLRVFEYSETTSKSPQTDKKTEEAIDYASFVTKREFEAFKGQIEAFMEGEKDE